jgi:hypothetical protein
MKRLAACLCISIMFFSVALSQGKIDVIYLKNGDIRKGTIIENVINDYIRIETSDGSIYTIKYAEIQKMTKEAKPASPARSPVQAAQQPVPAMRAISQSLMSRTGEFGVTAGLWLAGDISIDDFGVERSKNTGFLLRLFYDAYVAEKIGVGAYFNFSPTTSEASDYGATMFELGGSIKPRFPLGDGSAVIKPGLNIGYRMYSSDSPVMKDVKALGLNVSVEVQYNIQQIFVPHFEIGFLAQPVGGNSLTGISFPPIIYFGVGAAF